MQHLTRTDGNTGSGGVEQQGYEEGEQVRVELLLLRGSLALERVDGYTHSPA